MANSLGIPLRDGQVVLVDPKDMLKAMRGWSEYDCLFFLFRGLNEPGHMAYGSGTQVAGYRLNDVSRGYMQWNVGDFLICVCKRKARRCQNCGGTHGMWVRSDGTTLIKGQPCPDEVTVTPNEAPSEKLQLEGPQLTMF